MAFFGVPSAKAICGSEGGEDISSFDDILEALPKLVSRHESGHETLITVGRRRVCLARTAIVATAVDELLSFQEPICINHLLPPCCSGFLVPWCQLSLNAHHGSAVRNYRRTEGLRAGKPHIRQFPNDNCECSSLAHDWPRVSLICIKDPGHDLSRFSFWAGFISRSSELSRNVQEGQAMLKFGRDENSRLETGQPSREVIKPCSSGLKPTALTEAQIDAWVRHATASNGFGDAATTAMQRPDASARR